MSLPSLYPPKTPRHVQHALHAHVKDVRRDADAHVVGADPGRHGELDRGAVVGLHDRVRRLHAPRPVPLAPTQQSLPTPVRRRFGQGDERDAAVARRRDARRRVARDTTGELAVERGREAKGGDTEATAVHTDFGRAVGLAGGDGDGDEHGPVGLRPRPQRLRGRRPRGVIASRPSVAQRAHGSKGRPVARPRHRRVGRRGVGQPLGLELAPRQGVLHVRGVDQGPVRLDAGRGVPGARAKGAQGGGADVTLDGRRPAARRARDDELPVGRDGGERAERGEEVGLAARRCARAARRVGVGHPRAQRLSFACRRIVRRPPLRIGQRLVRGARGGKRLRVAAAVGVVLPRRGGKRGAHGGQGGGMGQAQQAVGGGVAGHGRVRFVSGHEPGSAGGAVVAGARRGGARHTSSHPPPLRTLADGLQNCGRRGRPAQGGRVEGRGRASAHDATRAAGGWGRARWRRDLPPPIWRD